ncbi:amidohydrolase family protein [Winogradskyella sp.]|nr:amidohydrolase family protein [Winogradskyella sp.]MDC0006954.1 amidohydrolase family protein [Winogradskyella sp.]MDC0006961.1 amidohydrolase family protein [Winogradskyella sp.]MDC1504013.1 amidohydrolase family protein [Winogradskyella sp.]
MKKYTQFCIALCLLFSLSTSFAQEDTKTQDSTKKATKELPLEPTRKINFTTDKGTWISVDVSPNGNTIIFDMMGDLYTIPINGGKATRITEGMPYDVHPRYSPDGKSILFISDKSGSDNLWTMNLTTKTQKQLTKDKNKYHVSAAWSPDGEYIVGTHGRRNIKPFIIHKDGGSGADLMADQKSKKYIDPAFSADDKHIYFSSRTGAWNYNAQLPQYQIMSFDREDADTETITSRYGSAFTPTLSKDGKWMVYGSRFEEHTGLVLRNLNTGEERWLAYPVQRDDQESIAPLGVLPAMAFTPNSKNLIASYGGKIYSIGIENGKATEIKFSVDVDLDMGPMVAFKYPIDDAPEGFVTQIRDAKPSPNGKQIAFTALNRLYVMDLKNGKPKRLTSHNFTEAMPEWSPDGKQIVFTTWKPNGGHLYKVNATGKGNAVKLTEERGIYSNPAWSYNSNRIAFTKGAAQTYDDAIDPFNGRVYEELAWISSNGGAITIIDKSKGRTMPHFTTSNDRLHLNHGSKGLISIRWDGTDEKEHLKLTGIKTYGSSDVFGKDHDHAAAMPTHEEGWRETNKGSSPSEIKISPDGKHALAKINNDIYTVVIPLIGTTPTINLAKPENAAFPAHKLTVMGGEFPVWSNSGKKVHWSLGASHFSYDLEKSKQFTDSLELANKNKKETKTDLTKIETLKTPTFIAEEFKVKVSYKRAIPKGKTLLKGGRIITMNGKQVIENGDILIENNRIVNIGASGSFTIPNDAKVIDIKGKTVTPGFVDTHAHMWPNWGIHKNQVWIYSANLAYGVTTTRDPQTAKTDVLTYSDMVEAGMIHGPRVYSTGPGVGYWAYNITSLEHAKDVLKQYSEYYNTKSIKSYLVGNRQQRQWVIMAAKELKLMPTTEGGLDFKQNMVNMMDGYPGHEHSFPIYPIYEDVIKTAAQSQMAITPTLLVSYGGPWAENYFYSRENPYADKKMQYFTPYAELAQKSRRRPGWFMDEEHVFKKHAKFMKDLIEADGIGGIGSHGQLQGLGFHWELWAVASGGMSNYDALRLATIKGCEALGLDNDLGTLEIGKIADINIMNANPLDNLRNTNTLTHVIKNGIVYDANTLDEIAPVEKKAETFHWQTKKPEDLPGVKN